MGLVLVVGVDIHTCLTPADTCGHSAVPTASQRRLWATLMFGSMSDLKVEEALPIIGCLEGHVL